MKTMDPFAPIGVFDSGLGGISVLKELRAQLRGEDFVFFGDRANAPYGNRESGEVLALTRAALRRFRERGCKAMVIACNTATATAADRLREENPDFPILAIEPALKPAVNDNPGGRILLMATPLAVKTPRIRSLAERFSEQASITLLPCPGLVEHIEEGHWNDAVIEAYLKELLENIARPDAVVLGCTHYPHISPALRAYFGDSVRLYDGGEGVARRLKQILGERGLLSPKKTEGSVVFEFSRGDENTFSLAQTLLK